MEVLSHLPLERTMAVLRGVVGMHVRIFWRLTAASLRTYSSQRLLGWAWWLLDPLALIAVYALVFGDWLNLRGGPEGANYPFFLACALIPWRWYSLATRRGGMGFCDEQCTAEFYSRESACSRHQPGCSRHS